MSERFEPLPSNPVIEVRDGATAHLRVRGRGRVIVHAPDGWTWRPLLPQQPSLIDSPADEAGGVSLLLERL